MNELEAPPPPGSDTPVPADVARTPRRRREAASAPDGLVPQTALEQRAERRERERRTRALPPPRANPVAQAAPSHVAGPYAPRPYVANPYASGPYVANPYAAGPYPPGPYASDPYAPAPSGPPPAWMPPPVLAQPPKRRLTRAQTRAALLGSLVGQTLLALATHLLVASLIVLLLWASFSEGDGDALDALDADSLTDVVAVWADPSRLPLTIVIVLIVTGAIAAAGCIASLLWHRSVGLVGIKRSIALAYATTTAIGGFVGTAGWPTVLIGGLLATFATSASFTMGTMWTVLLASLAVSVVLTGVVGMLFGWIYLLAWRPRPTWAQLEAEARQADVDAERRAVAADAAELGRAR